MSLKTQHTAGGGRCGCITKQKLCNSLSILQPTVVALSFCLIEVTHSDGCQKQTGSVHTGSDLSESGEDISTTPTLAIILYSPNRPAYR